MLFLLMYTMLITKGDSKEKASSFVHPPFGTEDERKMKLFRSRFILIFLYYFTLTQVVTDRI
jgi:hypothetical protein